MKYTQYGNIFYIFFRVHFDRYGKVSFYLIRYGVPERIQHCLEGMVNGNKVRDRRRYPIKDNIMINGLYENTRRKAEKRVEWRMLSLQ